MNTRRFGADKADKPVLSPERQQRLLHQSLARKAMINGFGQRWYALADGVALGGIRRRRPVHRGTGQRAHGHGICPAASSPASSIR